MSAAEQGVSARMAGEDTPEMERCEMGWWVYILRCADGTLYTGVTDDVERRAAAHNSGKGAKYTRGRGPVEVVYREACADRSAALRREAAIKKLPRGQKLALVGAAYGPCYDFAPLEGITGYLYRNAHHKYFGGVDRYYTPFLSPGQEGVFSRKELRDILPENNRGIELVPQLLTRRAEDFIRAAKELRAMGYSRVNLNLGCPSGTVTAKGKGAGFLLHPEELDRFLDAVFSADVLPVSVKTRLGYHEPAEFPALLEVFNRYPIEELIIHPRVRADFYKNQVRMEWFDHAVEQSRAPLCYNGNLVTRAHGRGLAARYPGVKAFMMGRGLVANPFLAARLKGDCPMDVQKLQGFHDELYEGYCESFQSRKNAVCRMKDVWRCLICLFADGEKHFKRLRKAVEPMDYQRQAASIFYDLELLEDAQADW